MAEKRRTGLFLVLTVLLFGTTMAGLVGVFLINVELQISKGELIQAQDLVLEKDMEIANELTLQERNKELEEKLGVAMSRIRDQKLVRVDDPEDPLKEIEVPREFAAKVKCTGVKSELELCEELLRDLVDHEERQSSVVAKNETLGSVHRFLRKRERSR